MAGTERSKNTLKLAVRGYNVYKNIWEPQVSEVLSTSIEPDNPCQRKVYIATPPRREEGSTGRSFRMRRSVSALAHIHVGLYQCEDMVIPRTFHTLVILSMRGNSTAAGSLGVNNVALIISVA